MPRFFKLLFVGKILISENGFFDVHYCGAKYSHG